MGVLWQETFEFAFDVQRVWDAYIAQEGGRTPKAGDTFTNTDAAKTRVEITGVVEAEHLTWTDTRPDGTFEMTMAFESTATGSRITVTKSGFGEGLAFDVLNESQALGWAEGMRDLASFLRTGINARRHLEDRSAMGIVLKQTDAGMQVMDVPADGIGTDAGLRPGDLLYSIDGAAVYDRTHIWLFARLYEPGREIEIGYARDGKLHSGKGRMRPISAAVVGEIGLGPRVEGVNA